MQRMLSQRARSYLATLRRDPAVPLARVERALLDRGLAPYPAWLEFHEQYAGYWEDLGGGSVAVWGLMHEQVTGVFVEPSQLYVTADKLGPIYIACADTHPSFGYNITPEGKFVGPPFPCASFGIKVERNALMWEFATSGAAQRAYDLDGVPIIEQREALLERLRPFHAPEASDRFANYYSSPDLLLLEALEVPTLKLLIRPRS
ncbi:MAG: hypothetical protein FJ104_07165 [Deltaproteobacteria bacterium]|nr:hypothetical protein [Deltaproteobacteria bacterium]